MRVLSCRDLGENIPGRGNNKCQGSKTGTSLACSRSSKQANVASTVSDMKERGGDEALIRGGLAEFRAHSTGEAFKQEGNMI